MKFFFVFLFSVIIYKNLTQTVITVVVAGNSKKYFVKKNFFYFFFKLALKDTKTVNTIVVAENKIFFAILSLINIHNGRLRFGDSGENLIQPPPAAKLAAEGSLRARMAAELGFRQNHRCANIDFHLQTKIR